MPSPLSLTGRRWVVRENGSTGNADQLPSLLATERGIALSSTAIERLSDPFLFSEMRTAVDRIAKAIAANETIAIFGDYDADGITASAQLIRYFRRRGKEPVSYLPDRLCEGYGMKKKSIDALHAKNVTLIITVDTGVTAHEEIAYAASLGIDSVITDHHRPQGGRPPAYAVIHPTIGAPFPNAYLCGAGVAFMLVRALEEGKVWKGIEQDIILATIGTIGDMMPLTGENRLLVIHGLKLIKKLPECPLKELIDAVRGTGPLTSGDIAFRVVPRLNAAGRMQHPSVALDALLHGGESIEALHRLNGERQVAITDALAIIRPLINGSHQFLFGATEHISPGIVGLVAGKLTEETGRPSLIASRIGELCTASIRSNPKIDVMRCLEHPAVRPFLQSFGGHAQAAGCTFLFSHAADIQSGLIQAVVDLGHTIESLIPEIAIDHELPAEHVSLSLVKDFQLLEPFGQGNEQPMFLIKNLKLQNMKVVGAEGTHLQLGFGAHRGIAFGLGSLAEKISPGLLVDIACSLSINVWNGREALQLMIEDVRTST